jgi:hypothetical protein
MTLEYEPEYDPLFGELRYDPSLERWYGDLVLSPFHQGEIAICWNEAENGPLAPVLQNARQAFKRFLNAERQHRERLATAMLERYRRSESSEDEMPTEAALAQRLTYARIVIATDGSMIVAYDGGEDLFGHHCIVADINADGSFAGFSLQG